MVPSHRAWSVPMWIRRRGRGNGPECTGRGRGSGQGLPRRSWDVVSFPVRQDAVTPLARSCSSPREPGLGCLPAPRSPAQRCPSRSLSRTRRTAVRYPAARPTGCRPGRAGPRRVAPVRPAAAPRWEGRCRRRCGDTPADARGHGGGPTPAARIAAIRHCIRSSRPVTVASSMPIRERPPRQYLRERATSGRRRSEEMPGTERWSRSMWFPRSAPPLPVGSAARWFFCSGPGRRSPENIPRGGP
jgi:hypothetical protein